MGLIPARAGNTVGIVSKTSAPGAHPRSRGEHFGLARLSPCRTGSSPLARGTPGSRASSHQRHGLIPARAGNTDSLAVSPNFTRAHPRSRGEHDDYQCVCGGAPGSSPLARGTLTLRILHSHRAGLIPARAGNTELRGAGAVDVGAHPRSRGEHARHGTKEGRRWGSSPLARGTQHDASDVPALTGLIPARAGNTTR